MPKYQMIVLNGPVEGREADFNSWYDDRHIDDVLAVPGVVAAQRFKLEGEGEHGYAAIYDVDAPDVGAVLADIGSRVGTERMPITDAAKQGFMGVFKALGPKREA